MISLVRLILLLLPPKVYCLIKVVSLLLPVSTREKVLRENRYLFDVSERIM